jgi:CheY-like chemotaxis protein
LHISQQGEDQLLALCRDVTEDIHHQQQLDALHKAGSELASLDAESLAEMGPAERIELLKQNIRRCTRELLHYDVIDLRLLDRRTHCLVPLLTQGMSPEATERQLTANPVNNGITGHVASTGKSYLCRDTATDPLYIQGAPGMRSSMTVPIVYQDEVVGTFNVESPKVNAFNEQDVQFLETFCRDLASALHTLELLTAEKRETATQAIDNISRGVALPVDEILSAGASLLERYIGIEAEMAEKIRLILNQAREIKQCIQKVGETITPPSESSDGEQPFKGMRVLVADNDEHVRLAAHGILGRWGCEVETARDGKEALTLAKQASYNAILADIRLPDMTGYDVFRRLRAVQPTAHVVLMTEYGYDPSHSLVKARQEGLKHVLFKPFRIDQLRDALNGCRNPREGGKPVS